MHLHRHRPGIVPPRWNEGYDGGCNAVPVHLAGGVPVSEGVEGGRVSGGGGGVATGGPGFPWRKTYCGENIQGIFTVKKQSKQIVAMKSCLTCKYCYRDLWPI